MNRNGFVFAALLSMIPLAHADGDKAEYERYMAQQRAAKARQEEQARQIAARQAESNAQMQKYTLDQKRAYLGAVAQGKSDDEVNRMYDAKVASDIATAAKLAARAQSQLKSVDAAQASQNMKQATGKSLEEMQNMSDEQLEALMLQMEKKQQQQ